MSRSSIYSTVQHRSLHQPSWWWASNRFTPQSNTEAGINQLWWWEGNPFIQCTLFIPQSNTGACIIRYDDERVTDSLHSPTQKLALINCGDEKVIHSFSVLYSLHSPTQESASIRRDDKLVTDSFHIPKRKTVLAKTSTVHNQGENLGKNEGEWIGNEQVEIWTRKKFLAVAIWCCVCVYVRMCIYVNVHLRVCVRVCVRVCARAHIYV